jgi:hypothetical protein
MSKNKETISINLSITSTWSIIKDVQDKTERLLNEHGASRDITEAIIMCASELLENAIKYGSSADNTNRVSFDLGIRDGMIQLSVSNGIEDEADVRNVKLHIERIRNTDNPGELYTERLKQLLENPKPGISQLGLYRIAFEGECTLDFTYRDGILIMRAERPFNSKP